MSAFHVAHAQEKHHNSNNTNFTWQSFKAFTCFVKIVQPAVAERKNK